MKYTFTEINNIVNGSILQFDEDTMLTLACIDTRQITNAATSLFFCLIGRNNGHQYIDIAYEKGIRNFIVSEEIDFTKYAAANFCRVENTNAALQQLAIYHRQQFTIPIIGITGSNGKTIVKEWLFQLLSTEKNIVKSPKSYNSQIGVPLSVLLIESTHELAIFEAGISTSGEMDKLRNIIRPSIGILTNIGSAHDAGFNDRNEKLAEKLKLFENCQQLIYCDKYVDESQLSNLNCQQISFGEQEKSIYRIIHTEKKNSSTIIDIISQRKEKEKWQFIIPFSDDASVENCLHCIIVLLQLGFSAAVIQTKISMLRNLPMRLELKYGINNCSIIDDSYSADFHSLQIALDFYRQQDTHKKRTLIISEFIDSGLSEKEFILRLKSILQHTKFDKIIGVGKAFIHEIESLTGVVKEWYVFESTEKLITQFNVLHFDNELVLLKGARVFSFEKITAQLIGQTHATVLEVNLNALSNNLQVYKSYIPKACGVIAMVKAFSYGSGSIEVARLLEKEKIDYLAVAYADEGVELRKNNIQSPIMVMNPDAVDFDRMLEYHLEPEIYSISILQQLIDCIGNRKIDIHIKVETGMNRLGFEASAISELIKLLHQHQNISVKTIFSHLAASEDAHFDNFTKQQIAQYSQIANTFCAAFNYPIKKHLANSSGILRFPEAHFDFVRLGIGLYGVDSASNIQDKLQVIGKLKTRIAQIKHVQAGETVGYSRKGVVQKAMKIAVLAIGYADGYDRRFGNGIGEVFIAGQRAKIIGNVCMDMCMADITHIDDVKDGDECEIYGKEISIIEQANKIGTISYELLTRISSRVKRLYYLD